MSTGDAVVTINVSAEQAVAALSRVARQFDEFLEKVLANPLARAAFERAQKQPVPLRGGHGAEYHRRTRTRTRSRR